MKKGQELAIIDSPDISVASSDVGKAQADLVAAQHDFDRQKDLYAQHAASQKDFEQAQDNFQKAQAEYQRARAKSSLLAAGGGSSVNEGYALRAPIDGTVMAVTREVADVPRHPWDRNQTVKGLVAMALLLGLFMTRLPREIGGLLIAALVASLVPAQRAANSDPMIILRRE